MYRTVALLMSAACLFAGCETKQPGDTEGEEDVPLGAIEAVLSPGKTTCLNDDGRGWSTVSTPVVAASEGGRVYVLSAQDFDEGLLVPSGVALIPAEMVLVTEIATVPALSVYDGKRWRAAQILGGHPHQCLPRFAWCSGEELHVLLEMADSLWHHLRYSPSANAWEDGGAMEASRDAVRYDFVLRAEDRSVHVATAGGGEIRYLRHDADGWSDPVSWRSEGELLTPKLAVAGDGSVHVVWTTWGSGTRYAVVKEGLVQQHQVGLGDRPIAETDTEPFGLGVAPDGRPFLVYKAELPEGHKDRNLLHMSSWDGGKWSAAAPLFTDRGPLLGSVKLTGSSHGKILTWQHRMDYALGETAKSHPVWSYAAQSPDGAWSEPSPALRLPGEAGYLGASTLCLHIDGRGLAHISWCDDSARVYHAILADLTD